MISNIPSTKVNIEKMEHIEWKRFTQQRKHQIRSDQSLSRVRLFATPWIAAHPGLAVHHQLPEFTQTHVHRVSDGIQPSHPLSSPSPPAPNPSQHHTFGIQKHHGTWLTWDQFGLMNLKMQLLFPLSGSAGLFFSHRPTCCDDVSLKLLGPSPGT